MNIALRGYKTIADIRKLLKHSDFEIVCIIDLNADLWGNTIDEIPIVSPMKAFDYKQKKKIDKIVLNPLLGINKITDIVKEMKNIGFMIDCIRIPKVLDVYEKNVISEDEMESNKYCFENFKNLYYLELHIVNECNLNCASCSHFSPLVKKNYYPQIQDIKRDMQRLGEIVDYIEWIRILGGEPLLNKSWKEYLRVTRQEWPYSKISLVTNGILLKKMNDEDYEFLRRNEIWVDISLYKPLWNEIDEIVAALKAQNIKYEMNSTPIFDFTSIFELNSPDDYIKKRLKCNASCNNLYKGKMTPCPIMMFVDIFNEYFEQNLPVGQPVDLYDNTLNYMSLIKALNRPMPICQYCNMNESKPWKQVNKKKCDIEDWIVMEN